MESAPVVFVRLSFYLLSLFFELLEWTLVHSTEVVWGCVCLSLGWIAFRWIFKIKVTIHPATSRVFQEMVLAFQRESMFCEETIETTAIGNELDADLTDSPLLQTVGTTARREKLVKSNRRVAYAVRVAHDAKAEVGLLANTKANELVYARVCREAMNKHNVRKAHIAHTLPIAVAACFIPLDSDFLAASLRQSSEMTERRALLGPLGGK